MRRYRNYSRYIYIHKVILHTINTWHKWNHHLPAYYFLLFLNRKSPNKTSSILFPLQDIKLLESPFYRHSRPTCIISWPWTLTGCLPLSYAKPDLPPKPQVIPTGKTQDWTDTSADITFPHFPWCMPPPATRPYTTDWIICWTNYTGTTGGR